MLLDGELLEEDVVLRAAAEAPTDLRHLPPDVPPADLRTARRRGEEAGKVGTTRLKRRTEEAKKDDASTIALEPFLFTEH